MMKALQNFDENLKDSRGMVLASPNASQTRGLVWDFKACDVMILHKMA